MTTPAREPILLSMAWIPHNKASAMNCMQLSLLRGWYPLRMGKINVGHFVNVSMPENPSWSPTMGFGPPFSVCHFGWPTLLMIT
jgi:hypothetical protein